MLVEAQLISFLVFVAVVDRSEGHRKGCRSNQLRCFNGYCMEKHHFCNKANNCGDNTDESFCDIPIRTRCPTEETQWYRCGSRCIPRAWQCDGKVDCPDSSDEIRCEIMKASPGVPEVIKNLTQKFMMTRQSTSSINKWGPHLLRTAVALFLSDISLFAPGNPTGEEIAYELTLRMLSKLTLKKKISTHELALFINALTVSCINPKDFFGVDLVAELRSRADKSNYTNPFLILTLCKAGDVMTPSDVRKVNSTFHSPLQPLWTDIQALSILASACMASYPELNVGESTNKMVAELKKKQHENGTFGNLKTTAVALQALITADWNLNDFDIRGAIKYVLRELNTTNVTLHNMYYILPLLNSKSLVNISTDHCSVQVTTDMEVFQKLRGHPNERVQARVSVFFWDEIDFVRKWELKVPPNYSFYQVLEIIGSMEPAYKVQYGISEDFKPYVRGVSKFFNDAEDGMFWYIYTRELKNATNLKLVQKSPVDIQLNTDEEIILWYKSEV